MTSGFSAQPGAHLVLVGLPGSGKTTVGVSLSHRLRRPFLDFDEEITRRSGKSVAEIFATEGEASFREKERQLTEELVGKRPSVLAPGGGWIMNEGVVALLRPPSRIIHLRVPLEVAMQRIVRSHNVRPLFANRDLRDVIDRLWREREPFYAQADWDIDAQGLDSKQVTELIVALAQGATPGLG